MTSEFSPSQSDKPVVVILRGGPSDGTFRSDATEMIESAIARGTYRITNSGTVGKRTRGLSVAAIESTLDGTEDELSKLKQHVAVYEVTSKSETDEEIIVTLVHVQQAT